VNHTRGGSFGTKQYGTTGQGKKCTEDSVKAITFNGRPCVITQ